MTDDLSVAVERLRASTQRLNAVSDVAANVIRDAEAFLEECHIGLNAWVEVTREDATGLGHFTVTQLSYQRHKGKFRIVVVIIPFDAGPEDEIVRPWAESTRDEKIESLGKLPELLVALAKQVEERTTKAEQAVASVSSLLKLPKKKGGA
jgi:hypothetical protein